MNLLDCIFEIGVLNVQRCNSNFIISNFVFTNDNHEFDIIDDRILNLIFHFWGLPVNVFRFNVFFPQQTLILQLGLNFSSDANT